MSNAEKIERWIAEWETKRDAAREVGDYDALPPLSGKLPTTGRCWLSLSADKAA